jgi:ActR/RegA family two-component response regulator
MRGCSDFSIAGTTIVVKYGQGDSGLAEARPMSDYIRGIRILIVEDEYVIATELAGQFEEAGAEVLGPVPSIKGALGYVQRPGVVQGAILDLHIRDGLVFPVADELGRRNIPYVFYTAYSREVIPVRHRAAERLLKPADWKSIARALFEPPILTVLH